MNRIIACLICLVAGGLLAADKPESDGVKIAPKNGKFEVEFPDKPKETGTANSKIYRLERDSGKGNVILQVKTEEIPKIDIAKDNIVKITLDNAQKGIAKSFEKQGGKITSTNDLKLNDKYPARDVEIDVPKQGTFRLRMVLTPERLYQISILGSKDYLDGKEAMKFWDSFKLPE
jgi:hypothetical protein